MDEEKTSLKVIDASLKSYNLNDGKILIPMHKIAYVQFGSTKQDDKDNDDITTKLNGNLTFCNLTPVSYIVVDDKDFKEYKLNENEDLNKWIEFIKMAAKLLKKK